MAHHYTLGLSVNKHRHLGVQLDHFEVQRERVARTYFDICLFKFSVWITRRVGLIGTTVFKFLYMMEFYRCMWQMRPRHCLGVYSNGETFRWWC